MKAATKAMVAAAITEAAASKQGVDEYLPGMKAGEVVIVPGMNQGTAYTLGRLEQAAAKALATQGRTMATPNSDAMNAGVHKQAAPKGARGIGGRANPDHMRGHIAAFLADEGNRGKRGWSACPAHDAYQRANPGKGCWPIYRALFGEAVAELAKAGGDKAAERVALIEQAKGQAMAAGLDYGQGDGAEPWADRFATWCKANHPEAAKALAAMATEREQAAKVAKAKAAERAKAAKAAAAAKAKAATQAKATKATPATKAAAPKASTPAKATRATKATKAATPAKAAPRRAPAKAKA